jgi:nucleotide-binding universal stress UspA family protein
MAAQSEFDAQSGFVGAASLAWRGPHPWHQGERVWSATNSRLDVWIELLHALGLEPAPVLLNTLCADFLGDQWSLTSVLKADLWACYGIAVEELFVWRPLLAHLVEQLDRGNAVLIEVDAFHLPDTAVGSYQRAHVKTMIAVTGYDRNSHRLRYLHGGVGAEIDGEDLDALLAAGIGGAQLPPFAQVVRLERHVPRTELERAQIGVELARFHGTRIPAKNPVRSFGDALRTHGAWLTGGDSDHYQRWAYATLQQCGASFELSADVCVWLTSHGEPVGDAIEPLRAIAKAARALHQRLARVPQSGRMPDVSQAVDEMAQAWDAAMRVLKARYSV